jgi:cbb3-type cytochrome oxidase subunit 1
MGMVIQKELNGTSPDQQLITAHTHVILVGFVMLMIMGVAQWMFPRPLKDDTRYSPDLARYVFYTVSLGVLVRTVAEIVSAFHNGMLWHWGIVIGSVLEIVAMVLPVKATCVQIESHRIHLGVLVSVFFRIVPNVGRQTAKFKRNGPVITTAVNASIA